VLRDEIDYEPPLGFLGRAIAPILVTRRLGKSFSITGTTLRVDGAKGRKAMNSGQCAVGSVQ